MNDPAADERQRVLTENRDRRVVARVLDRLGRHALAIAIEARPWSGSRPQRSGYFAVRDAVIVMRHRVRNRSPA